MQRERERGFGGGENAGVIVEQEQPLAALNRCDT
jgi:hypothetical protein